MLTLARCCSKPKCGPSRLKMRSQFSTWLLEMSTMVTEPPCAYIPMHWCWRQVRTIGLFRFQVGIYPEYSLLVLLKHLPRVSELPLVNVSSCLVLAHSFCL